MAKQISQKDLDKLIANGANIKPKIKAMPKPAPINTDDSSTEMKAAVAAAQRTAEAAVQTAQVANGLMEETKQTNKKLVEDVVKAIKETTPGSDGKIIKLKIKRKSDKLVDEILLVREGE